MLSTFIAKFIVAMSFAIPFILLDLSTAMIISVAWGLALLSALSYFIAKIGKKNAWIVIGEHLIIAIVVIIIAYFFGEWIYATFSP